MFHELPHRLPGKRHARLHRVERNRLVAFHREHRALGILGMNRGEAKAAVAVGYRGHAMPASDRAGGIPEHRRVVMAMEIDRAGRDYHSAGVEGLFGVTATDVADASDAAVLDADVRLEGRG